MKTVAVICNFLLPGLGSFFIKQIAQGIAQLLIWAVGLFLTLSMVGAIIGIPLMIAAWIWGLVGAATYDANPTTINVIHTQSPGATISNPPSSDPTIDENRQ